MARIRISPSQNTQQLLEPRSAQTSSSRLNRCSCSRLTRRIARDNMSRYLSLPNYTNNLKRMGFTDEDISSVSDRLVDAIVPWGSVETVAARVQEHFDAGADHVCVQALTESPDHLPIQEWAALAEALV